MLCKCGVTCPEGTAFCSQCGARFEKPAVTMATGVQVTETVIPQVPLPPRNNMNPIIFVAIGGTMLLLLAAIMAVVFILLGGGSKFDFQSGGFNRISVENGFIITDSRGRTFEIDGWLMYSATSLDGTRHAVLNEYGDLFFIYNGNMRRVAQDVVMFVMSADGSTVAFITDFSQRDNLGRLVVWQARNDAVRVVDGNALPWSLAISPNGGTIGFSAYDDRGNMTCFVSVNGGTPESIGRDRTIVAVSDRGRFVYYLNNANNTLNVRSNGESVRLSTENLWGIMFNRDLSEVVFVSEDSTFISVRGGSRERISNNSLGHVVLPMYVQRSWVGNVNILGIRTFGGNVFAGWQNRGLTLVYLDNNFETTTLASGVVSVAMANDGETIVYADTHGTLVRLENLSRHEPVETVLGTRLQVEHFVISSDASQVYFMNSQGNLYFISGASAPSRVSTDVRPFLLVMSPNSDTLFFLANAARDGSGDMFTITRGGVPTRVSGANDVVNITVNASGVYYFERVSFNAIDVFRSSGNASFTRIVSGARW